MSYFSELSPFGKLLAVWIACPTTVASVAWHLPELFNKELENAALSIQSAPRGWAFIKEWRSTTKKMAELVGKLREYEERTRFGENLNEAVITVQAEILQLQSRLLQLKAESDELDKKFDDIGAVISKIRKATHWFDRAMFGSIAT